MGSPEKTNARLVYCSGSSSGKEFKEWVDKYRSEKDDHIIFKRFKKVKVRDITLFWQSMYPHLPVRVQVEDLRWSQHSSRSEVGYYLAHNQKNFFHSQVQQAIVHLLCEHGIGVWRVDARNTSQICAICGHLEEGQRHGKTFKCKNENHNNSKGSPYTTNADLNAGRNVVKAPPLTLSPIIP